HQDSDMLSRHSLHSPCKTVNRAEAPRLTLWTESDLRPLGYRFVPIRLISQSSAIPLCSLTRRRTSSPKFSISAAVALPRLIRKLQCSSDTCAAPTTRPRQPAASISCQALWPGGFLKVEPPVRLFTGWVASRAC